MPSIADDLRKQYRGVFRTLRGIAAACPEERWRAPHGDDYLIPCRIAYHIGLCIKYHILSGFADPEYYNTLPYGRWNEANAADLPGKEAYGLFLEGILGRAEAALEALDDGALLAPPEPQRAWAGGTLLGVHLYLLRELSDHTGELNAMLLQDGAVDSVWFIN